MKGLQRLVIFWTLLQLVDGHKCWEQDESLGIGKELSKVTNDIEVIDRYLTSVESGGFNLTSYKKQRVIKGCH